ncbi:WD40 domain-containing protein [Pseudanabaena mucicola]|uniref:NACHT domain-containing protein n=1 Tax=Pseudanabaena mucicola FACHB-723 TaxID=2692860 RepID=A0ABR7ZT68_9CYAN|nr:NB-ARC domain-containing protein [Pseudanabaena mucicola]MBD2186628.1 NACHT domain-containing protein [Pseudanabaena mucicola FACHB-723]
MTKNEAIALVTRLLGNGDLKEVQKLVLSQSWDGNKYSDMAIEKGYDLGYIRDVGSGLWRALSQALNEKVTKNNLRGVLERYAQQQAALNANSETSQIHMGEAIDVAKFCGRTQELETLREWILADRCRVVTILGMGGMGKTSLSVKIAEQLQGEFDYVIWRSLRHAPTFSDKMGDCLKILSQQQITTLPTNSHEQITCLIEYFRKYRCLLILDNFDTLLHHGQATGTYLDSYEAYGELLWRVGETSHQSCVLITSREKPSEVTALEGDGLAVRTLALSGLELEAAKTILDLKGLSISDAEARQLVDCYSGNPLALKIAATSIRDLYAGNVNYFLASGITLFNGINNLLSQQLKRLSDLQNQVMYWLVIHRESISLTDLHSAFTPLTSKLQLMEVLESLVNCNLIERDRHGFTQQPVVMEYVTDRLTKLICQEIVTESSQYLLTHALVQAQAKDYIRDSQIQLIVQPILQQLQNNLVSKKQVEYQLGRLITTFQNEANALNVYGARGLSPLPADNYGGANLLHLLVHLGTDLTGYDFSRLMIRDCDLRSQTLHRVNFTQAHFRDCLFAATFGGITSVAFSPDGLALASSDTNGEIQIWDAVNGKQLFICQGHNSWVWHVAFSPKSPILASCGQDHTIKLWNTNNGECFRTLDEHINIVTAIAFSPDGQLLASSSTDRTVKIWNMVTGESMQTLAGHNACVWSVDFHPNGQLLASAAEDNTIKLWNLETGECVQTLQGHQYWVKAIAFSPDGKTLASGSFDSTVKIWNWQTGECLKTLLGHNSVVTSLEFSPQGDRLVTGSYDQSVKIWDVATGKCLDTMHKHTNRVWSVAFHPQANLVVSGGDDHGIKIWELQRGKCIKTLQGNSNAIYAIAYDHQQNLLASGHEDQTLKLWNVDINAPQSLETDLQPFQILRGHCDRILSVAFSPNGQILASGSADRTVKLWNPHTGKLIKTLQGHRSWVWGIAISPDSKFLASGSYDHTVKLWNLESGECLQTLQGHPSSVLSVRFNHDGKTLFSSGYDKLVKYWHLETGECLHTWEADSSNRVWAMEISPNSQYLATGGDDHSIKLWDIATGECLRLFSGHYHPVISLIFTPNGDRLISGSSDRTVKIWDVLTGNCLETLKGHGHWVASLAISQDAKTLISGSWDETIQCWDIPTGQCLQTLRSLSPYRGMIINDVRGLTQAEIDTLKALGALET